MRTVLESVFLSVVGVALCSLGVASMGRPDLVAKILGATIHSVAGWSELRGYYGGVHLSMGLFLLAAVRVQSLRAAGLWVLGVVTVGYTAGRTVSVLADGVPASWMLATSALEFLGAAVVAALLVSRSRVPS